MQDPQLTVAAVRRSLRTFRDHADDLLRADWQMFGDGLNQLANFCRTDLVFSTIHDQLSNRATVDLNNWLNKNGRVQLSGLRFPPDPDDRLSLQYQLIIDGAKHPGMLMKRAMVWFHRSGGDLSSYVRSFAEAIMRPLFRDLGYRLEEIEERLPSDRTEIVSAASLQIIHVESANVRIDKHESFEFHNSKNVQVGSHNLQDNRE